MMIQNVSAHPPPTLPPKPTGNCACGDKVCIKTLLDRIRGALIATVRNMIILISSEHLPLPPPCVGPGRPCHGFKLPEVDDLFKSENCVCDSKHH